MTISGDEAVYTIAGETAVASPHAAGPWDPSVQHGSAPAALVAWVAESLKTPVPMQVARITVDLLRPVPIAPLSIHADVIRQGRKIQLVAIRLAVDGTDVVRATVLKVRSIDLEVAPEAPPAPMETPGPEMGFEPTGTPRTGSPFLRGISIRRTDGSDWRLGASKIWFRADRPIVSGQPISPLMSAMITADFTNGASTTLDPETWTFINGDLSVNLARMPLGEWILLDAETWVSADGRGVAAARMADKLGYFARVAQSLVIDRRASRRAGVAEPMWYSGGDDESISHRKV